MMKILKFLTLCIVALTMASCGENEEKIEGCWERHLSEDGLNFVDEYCFTKGSRSNSFTASLRPLSANGIGYTVRGTWETDITDDLVLTYDLSTLKPLCGSYVSSDDMEVSIYIMTIRNALLAQNIQMDQGAYIGLEFYDDNSMALDTADETAIYNRTL